MVSCYLCDTYQMTVWFNRLAYTKMLTCKKELVLMWPCGRGNHYEFLIISDRDQLETKRGSVHLFVWSIDGSILSLYYKWR